MRQTVRFGRIAGIPIGSHWSVLVIMVILVLLLAVTVLPAGVPDRPEAVYWAVAAVVAVLFMVALLAHELAHALVARHYKIRVRAITLWLLGGVSELDGQAPHARGELLIALAGPLVSLAAAAGFGALALVASALGAGDLAVAALVWLALVNVVLGVFNLLPGAPLDGGRILSAVVWWLRGDRATGRRVASRAGVVLGLLLVAAGLAQVILLGNLGGLWLALIGWFLVSAANAENTDVQLRKALGGSLVGEVMTAPAVAGYAHQTVAGFVSTVVRHRPHRSYPVLDLDGRLTGLVTLTRLARVPPAARDTVRLAEIQAPRTTVTVLHPDQPLSEVAATVLSGGHRLAPVTSDGHLAGVLSSSDLARAVELAGLGEHPDRAGRSDQAAGPLPGQEPPPR
jgi:Zn-dependent protease